MSWCVSCLLQAGLVLLRFVLICLLCAALKVLAMRLCFEPLLHTSNLACFSKLSLLWGIVCESFSRATSCLARQACVAHFPALKWHNCLWNPGKHNLAVWRVTCKCFSKKSSRRDFKIQLQNPWQAKSLSSHLKHSCLARIKWKFPPFLCVLAWLKKIK